MEGESEEQSPADQASAAKTRSVFIAQNVASLLELGESLSALRKGLPVPLLGEGCQPSASGPIENLPLLIQGAPRSCSEYA